MSKARWCQLHESPLLAAGLAYIFPRVPFQLYSWWASQDCAQPPQRDCPRTPHAGMQIPDPPLSGSGELYLKPAFGGRPTGTRRVVEPESAVFSSLENAGPPSVK
jgi:hypothetical protein